MKNERVKGKVALVTGAALGIGRACALRLAEAGAAVAVTDIRDKEGEAVVEEICARGGRAIYWYLDVRRESEVERVLKRIKLELGNVTVLVNNAGTSGPQKPTHEIASEEWDALMAINVKGVFFMTKHTLPQMFDAGSGSIINMSSIYGLVGAADLPAYHASKGAVRLMSKTDAMLYASQGIRVNSVHPGFIWTPLVEALATEPGQVAALAALHPLGHMGEPDDIAHGVVYLASDESKFVTGSELIIDGGYTAR